MAFEMPPWFGRRYPKREDLEDLAWMLDCVVLECPVACFYHAIPGDEFHVIGVPSGCSHLEEMWMLAHEVGHLLQHHGYTSRWAYGKQENQAAKWAACALIPEARIRRHANASMDAMIAALSAHYEDIPLEPCPIRETASVIAKHRLRALEETA